MNAINQIESPFGAITVANINGQPMVDGVQLASMGGKRVDNWTRLDSTKELISALESTNPQFRAIVIEESVFTPGIGKTPQRVWLGEELTYDLAQWVSIDFRVACLQILKSFFRGEFETARPRLSTLEEICRDKIAGYGVTWKGSAAALRVFVEVINGPAPRENKHVDLGLELLDFLKLKEVNSVRMTVLEIRAELSEDLQERYINGISLGKGLSEVAKMPPKGLKLKHYHTQSQRYWILSLANDGIQPLNRLQSTFN